MTFPLVRNVVSKIALQVFRYLGYQQLREEKHPNFWHSDCSRALHHLKQSSPKSPSLRQFDWNRICSPKDLQRIVSSGAGQSPTNRDEPIRNRGRAFTTIFSLLTNWNRWNLFENRWLVASSLYESSIHWAEIPHWLRFFCQSISEPHDNNWSGIYLDAQTLVQPSTLQLLHDRDAQKGTNPAIVILETSDGDLKNLSGLLSLLPPSMKPVPFWVQDHQPLALWDQEHSAFRVLALGQSFLELTEIDTPATQKFTLPTAPLYQEMDLAWSNPQSGISKPLRTKISVVSRSPLLIQPGGKPALRPPATLKRFFRFPLPPLSHPQTSGNGAKPAKSPSHTPW